MPEIPVAAGKRPEIGDPGRRRLDVHRDANTFQCERRFGGLAGDMASLRPLGPDGAFARTEKQLIERAAQGRGGVGIRARLPCGRLAKPGSRNWIRKLGILECGIPDRFHEIGVHGKLA